MNGRVGSLCSGFGGLDLGLERAGFIVAWHAELDAACSAVLDLHWPGVPNHGDLKAIDWGAVEPVDLLCGGYPCQPFSHAGRRRGEDDPRHLWPFVLDAIRHLRPRLAILENVSGHRSLGFGRVLGDLAEVGFDACWASVRASDVGAPHGRERVFILAAPADPGCLEHERRRGLGEVAGAAGQGEGGQAQRQRVRDAASGGREAAADLHGGGREGRGQQDGGTLEPGLSAPRRGDVDGRRAAPADADQSRPQGRQPARGRHLPTGSSEAPADATDLGQHGERGARRRRTGPEDGDQQAAADAAGERVPDGAVGALSRAGGGDRRRAGAERADVDRRSAPIVAWGEYEPAIRRWEAIFGEPAPDPLDGRGRLNVDLTRWMMGFPPGWHGDASRTAALRGYGNAVQVQVAEHVGRWAT